MEVKEIREKLQKGNTRFTIEGITTYCRSSENGEYGMNPKVFKVQEEAESIYTDETYSVNGMNVDKWGPTCVTLYTFDMLNKISKGKIKYSNVTILD